MTNLALNQNLVFDTELILEAPFTSSAQQLLYRGTVTPGVLRNIPVIMFIKNQSTVGVFFADNEENTDGMSMVEGESIVLDCRANHGNATNMGFQIGTSFFVTGTGGTGHFTVSLLYAK